MGHWEGNLMQSCDKWHQSCGLDIAVNLDASKYTFEHIEKGGCQRLPISISDLVDHLLNLYAHGLGRRNRNAISAALPQESKPFLGSPLELGSEITMKTCIH